MQNILVVTTSSEQNAKAYPKRRTITIGAAEHELSAYHAAPENTCQSIIINVDMEFDQEQLKAL